VTANFKTFLVRMDGADWKESPAELFWTLHPELNIIEAKPVNSFGREGMPSRIEIEMNR
jgi:hypothetical protein